MIIIIIIESTLERIIQATTLELISRYFGVDATPKRSDT